MSAGSVYDEGEERLTVTKTRKKIMQVNKWLLNGSLALCLILVVLVLIYAGAFQEVQKNCLKQGWPQAELTIDFYGYCIREIDETEHVCMVADLACLDQGSE